MRFGNSPAFNVRLSPCWEIYGVLYPFSPMCFLLEENILKKPTLRGPSIVYIEGKTYKLTMLVVEVS